MCQFVPNVFQWSRASKSWLAWYPRKNMSAADSTPHGRTISQLWGRETAQRKSAVAQTGVYKGYVDMETCLLEFSGLTVIFDRGICGCPLLYSPHGWLLTPHGIWIWVTIVSVILGCPVVDHLTIITRIDNIGKLYGQRLTYLHNLQGGYCMQNYIKPQSRKKYRRNSHFYNSWSTCHPTWLRVRWSISTAHARISREKSFCINYDNYV